MAKGVASNVPGWLTEALIALLAPAAALVGSYWGSKVAGRDRLRFERRVETAETVLALLDEIGSDLAVWVDPRNLVGSSGRALDKFTEGTLILGKLRRLRSYRKTRSMWLDPWLEPGVVKILEDTLDEIGRRHAELFNNLPANEYGMVPEGSPFEEIRAEFSDWLRDGWVEALHEIERGLIGSLGRRSF